MGATSIEWTEISWNPVRGCSRVSPGCDHCYAIGQARRTHGPGGAYEGLTTIRRGRVDWTGFARLVPEQLDVPLRRRKPARYFVNSMSDLFHESLTNEEIAAVFGAMATSPWHTFQVLTKRAKRMLEWFEWVSNLESDEWTEVHYAALQRDESGTLHAQSDAAPGRPWPLPNVWIGVSAENQETADKRIPLLLKCPAAVRWVSAEPLLGPLDARPFLHRGQHRVCPRCLFATNARITDTVCPNAGCGGTLGTDIALDWVVVGSESGHRARPMALDWITSLRDQCSAAGVPFFAKQISNEHDKKGGNPEHWPPGPWPREFPNA